jgi:hypothetical protein
MSNISIPEELYEIINDIVVYEEFNKINHDPIRDRLYIEINDIIDECPDDNTWKIEISI